MNIITEDFQSLKGVNNFEFNPGINIIIGPNGSGKSSLFYAVENCLDNPNGVDDCINHEIEATRVTLNNNGESITWIREKGSSTYINNNDGNTYVKASKLTSKDLADLGFYFDKKGRIMNIHNEWSTLFPFGESDNDMFRLFEDIFNISCSFDVLDNIKKDSQGVKGQIKQLKLQKEQHTERLNKLNEIASQVNLIDINNIIEDLYKCSSSEEALRQDYNQYSTNCPFCRIVLPAGFDISSLYAIDHEFEELQAALKEYKTNQNIKNIDISLKTFDLDIEDHKELKTDYDEYINLKCLIEGYQIELNSLHKDRILLDQELEEIAVCPTCGRPL